MDRLGCHQDGKVVVGGVLEVLEKLDDLVEGYDSKIYQRHSKRVRIGVSNQNYEEKGQKRENRSPIRPVFALDEIQREGDIAELVQGFLRL